MPNINISDLKLENITEINSHNLEQNNSENHFQERLKYLISSFELELTVSQEKALTKLWQFIHSPNQFFLLAGYAGTGKSTIVFAVIKELLRLGKRVAM